MAPEAIRGEQFVDGRSDIYALGGVGIFLLTGEPVFAGQNLVEVVAHHLTTQPVPPSQRGVGQVPSDVEAVLMRCLESSRRPASTRPATSVSRSHLCELEPVVARPRCAILDGSSGRPSARALASRLDGASDAYDRRRRPGRRARPAMTRKRAIATAVVIERSRRAEPGHAGDFDRQVDGSIRDSQRLHHQPGSERVLRHRGHEVLRAT